jgi:hypothetical protein
VRRQVVGLIASAGLVVALVGCGRQDGSGQVSVGEPKTAAARAVVAAAQATEQLDTGTFKTTFTEVTDHDTSQNISATVTGSFDQAAHRYEIQTVATVPALSDGNRTATGPIVEIRDGDTLYLELAVPPGTPTNAGTKPWVSEPLPAQMAGLGPFGFFSTGIGVDALADLEHVTGGVTDLGPANVDGVDTTHYSATLTPQDMVAIEAQVMSTAPAKSPFGTEPLSVADQPTLHVQLWIDGAGLLRRYTMDGTGVIDTSVSSDDTTGTTQLTRVTGTMSMTFDLLTANQPVDIQIPPPDQVTAIPACVGVTTTSATSESSTTDATDPGVGFNCTTSIGASGSGIYSDGSSSGTATTTAGGN